MTPSESNALIAKALSSDPDPKRGEWGRIAVPCTVAGCVSGQRLAWGEWCVCSACAGTGRQRIPRDFADDENTLKLIQWASGQAWYDDVIEYDGTPGQVGGHVRHYMERLVAGEIKAEEAARQVRDVMAAKLKEVAGD